MSFNQPDLKYIGTVSGDVTTVVTDEVIAITNGAGDPVTCGSLSVKCVTACEIKVNSEANYHKFDAGDTFNFADTPVTQIVVKDIGSNVRYYGGYFS